MDSGAPVTVYDSLADGSAIHLVELTVGISPDQLKSWLFIQGIPEAFFA
jgi:hypothetical protein